MTFPRRIVVTGMGAVSAAGVGAEALWTAARDGRSCVSETIFPRGHKGRIKISAQVKDFDPLAHLDPKLMPFLDPVTQYLLVAADEAVAQAGLSRDEKMGPRTAAIIGTGIAGMTTIEDGHYQIFIQGGRPDPLTIPRLIPSTLPAMISMRYGTTGPTLAVGSACSSATQAIGLGAQMVRFGLADRAIVGGAEECVTSGTMLAWEALRVLTPNLCRPFSKNRNGMTLGAGAGVFVLEAEEVALARGAVPLAELAGYGTSSDAIDPVRPDAIGMSSAIRYALEDAGLPPDAVDYINAHGTGTVINDLTESTAMGMVFGKRASEVPISSTKPIHGHALGAGGALEFVVTLGALRDQVAPPTINFAETDEKCPVDAIPNEARPMPINVAMSNSFAFGGINAVLIARRMQTA